MKMATDEWHLFYRDVKKKTFERPLIAAGFNEALSKNLDETFEKMLMNEMKPRRNRETHDDDTKSR